MQLNPSAANPYTPVPSFSILSPYPSWDRCYPNASITIKVGILLAASTSEDFTPQIFYSLDDGDNTTLTNITKGEHWAKEYPWQTQVSFTANTTLYNLSEGNHTLSAYSYDAQGKTLLDKREFIVDSFYKDPELTLISPKNINYTKSQVQLIFLTNKEYNNARYILDYHLNSSAHYIPINGNITLTNLTDGIHKIIVIADCHDEYHHGISVAQGTRFNVSINENTTEIENNLPTDDKPIFLSVTTIMVIVVISSALLSSILVKKRLSMKKVSSN